MMWITIAMALLERHHRARVLNPNCAPKCNVVLPFWVIPLALISVSLSNGCCHKICMSRHLSPCWKWQNWKWIGTLLYIYTTYKYNRPQLSWVTGFENDTTTLTPGPVSSIYIKLKERNRCVHRDFQNICVNGARTGAMKDIIKSYQRNQTADNPAIVFYALVGNEYVVIVIVVI